MELVKAIGGIAWVIGLVMLFVVPQLGMIILAVAIVATLLSRAKDRERKHAELVQVSRQVASTSPPPPPPAPPTPSTADRLAHLEELKESGAISNVEYETKRKKILDDL